MFRDMYTWLDTGSVILIYIIALCVAKIMTNDLPHITERLANLEGRNVRVDSKRRKR